jgi:transcriptional regulator GlxA family with amidase domain
MMLAAFMLAGASSVAAAQEKKDAAKLADQPAQRTIGVLLYPTFEPLDVFGPVEMFMAVPANLCKVVFIAEKAGPVEAGTQGQKGPKVYADYGYEDAPKLDILLVPGGFGTLPQLQNEKTLNFIRERTKQTELTTSVCSGSAILAKAGVLDGMKATSNKSFFDQLITNGPKTHWVRQARWVEDGKMVTSSGVSAGIDMALAVIEKLWGAEMADGIAKGTEYIRSKDPHNDPFAKVAEKK